jgi:hypothetical protein
MDQVQIENALEGGCLCGALRYRIEPGPADSAYCHCTLCRRASGSPAVPWFTLPRARFSYVKGTPRRYRSSATATREFCGSCGSPILFDPDGNPRIDISSATLDDPASVPPRYHIWRMSRIAWFETADALPRFDDRGPDL